MTPAAIARRRPAAAVRVVYRSGRGGRVRFLFAVFAAFLAVMAWLALDAARSYGASPGDGGVLQPLATRLAVASVILALGVTPLTLLSAYARRYVTEIRADVAARQAEIDVLAGRGLRVAAADLAGTEPGFPAPAWSRLDVDAPWVTVRLASGRALVVDLRGETVDAEALRALFEPERKRSSFRR